MHALASDLRIVGLSSAVSDLFLFIRVWAVGIEGDI